MAEKTENKAGNVTRESWFDLIPEEERDELKAKQWQTEYRATDDESAIGNLHYGTETERDNLQDKSRQSDMEYVRSDLDLPSDSLPRDATTIHRASTMDSSGVDMVGRAPSVSEHSLSAEALSSGATSSLSVDIPDIAHAGTEAATIADPEVSAAIPEVHRAGVKSTATVASNEGKDLSVETGSPVDHDLASQHTPQSTPEHPGTTAHADGADPINHDPHGVDDAFLTQENSAITLDVLANDSDADGDTLHISAASVQEHHGMVTIRDDATLAFDPGADFDHLAEGETRDVEITYTVDDGHGGTDTATATVTITGTNDGPVAVDDATATTENAAVTINVLANDSDIDSSDSLTVTNASVGNGQGNIAINDDGTLAFDPGADFDHLAVGETQDVAISYTVDDGHGGTDTATATVTVTGTNDAPVITETTPVTVTEESMQGFTGYGQAWEGDVYSVVTQEEMLDHLGITDADSGNFTVSLADAAPAWHGGIQANDSAFTSDTLQAGSNPYDETVIQVTPEFLDNYPNVDAKVGDFYFDHVDFDKLSEGEIAKINFSVQVSDGVTTSEPKDFDITVTGSNDAPTVTGTVELAGDEDTSLSFTAADLLTNA
ncbi:MAG TPA: tandem-95 repeat protein, partial [Desulfobulbus sp.]|nr:tandem-95 repeat protein [Desulfobulbus sp.]